MAQPNDIFVDPSIAGDSGAGTSGDPYGDLEWALEQTTPNSNGDAFNIKAGTDEVVEFALDIFTDYGTPTETAPLVFQGYTTAARDGGIGGISGGGSVSVVSNGSLNYTQFIDLHCHNCGSNTILATNNECCLIRCELNNAADGAHFDSDSVFIGNYVHDISGVGIAGRNNCHYSFNFMENGTKKFAKALRTEIGTAFFYKNIVWLRGAANASIGIAGGAPSTILNNSIWCNAGTGAGIWMESNADEMGSVLLNNLVEGFSGTGGVGIDLGEFSDFVSTVNGANSVENCTTDFIAAAAVTWDFMNKITPSTATNESLGASPFADVSETAKDFSPVDTGSVKEGSLPDEFGLGQ